MESSYSINLDASSRLPDNEASAHSSNHERSDIACNPSHSLEDDEKCFAFLEECVNVKGSSKIFTGTRINFVKVLKALEERHIYTDLAECQRKKKG